MAGYFKNFKIQQYGEANSICRAVTTRAAIAQTVMKNAAVFYPYDIRQGERPDTLAHLYYNSSDLEWLIFFANDIVDPYYDWYLNQEQFNAYLVEKYGSVAKAQVRTHHYEVNWITDDRKITVSDYNLLTANSSVNLKQYWEPIIDEYDHAISYHRKRSDNKTTTNQILSLNLDNLNGTFVDEDVYQTYNGTITASASIAASNTSNMVVQHVNGVWDNTKSIYGADSGATATYTTKTILKQNIPTLELTYWQAVSYYDYENQLNESKKTLKLMDVQFAEQAADDLSKLMR